MTGLIGLGRTFTIDLTFSQSLIGSNKMSFRFSMSEIVGHPVVLLDKHDIYAEGNMENISPTILIDISRTPSKVENVYIGADCSPEEIQTYTDLFKEF
jgi:hypothetical protein